MTGGNTLNGKQFISLCMLGHPQSQNDQLLIMTKAKGLEYDDQDNFCSMLHLFFEGFFFSCPRTQRDKGEIQVMSCSLFQACMSGPVMR